MVYKDFLLKKCDFLEHEIETNIKYNKSSIKNLLLLWYILDTYYGAKAHFDSLDQNLTLKIKGLLEYVAQPLGGCELDLEYIPFEHMFYWMYRQEIFEGYKSF